MSVNGAPPPCSAIRSEASGVVGGYVLALIFRPALCPPLALRLPLIAFCLASLMAFGGRTALVTVLTVIGVLGLHRSPAADARQANVADRLRSPSICLLFVGGGHLRRARSRLLRQDAAALFLRQGQRAGAVATFDLLSHFDWHELVLGPNPMRVSALQSQLGLNYGIENFWISCIVQFGIVHTALLTIGLICFFVEILRRSSRAAWAMMLLILVVAASSVSFSSKNIQLAQFVMLITLLLPRETPRVVRAVQHPRAQARAPAGLPVQARSIPT